MSATQRSIFDPDFIQSQEWDSRLARSSARDVTRNYHRDNHQSNLAHQSIEPKKTAMQRQIRDHITSCGRKGATCAEIEVALGMKHQTASARCSDLLRDHRIFWNGSKRAPENGQPGRVYVTSLGQIQ